MRNDRPEISNMLKIYAQIKDIDETIADQYFTDDNLHTFKNKLADAIIDVICPIGE